ncbi:MAG: Uncharacterised protein [Chloroflexota bacterium]|nr:MAG: Uncharacterised protein [Chloroflexota bacterium]
MGKSNLDSCPGANRNYCWGIRNCKIQNLPEAEQGTLLEDRTNSATSDAEQKGII